MPVLNYCLNKFMPILIIGFMLFTHFKPDQFQPYIIMGLLFFSQHFHYKAGYSMAFCESHGIDVQMHLEICVLLVACAASFIYSCRMKIAFDSLKKQNAKILSQKKSSEVKTGHITEKFAPFLDNFKHDPSKCVFLGQPIDYLCFEDEGITFCEVKSGQSKLSNKQKIIRDHVISGNVYWEEFRVD